MVTTLSTSLECGQAAGMKTVSASSFPAEASIDLFREMIYNEIKSVLGSTVTDSNGYARNFEIAHVKIDVLNIIDHTNNPSKPTIQEKVDLAQHFGLELIECFEPDMDSSLSGTGA